MYLLKQSQDNRRWVSHSLMQNHHFPVTFSKISLSVGIVGK